MLTRDGKEEKSVKSFQAGMDLEYYDCRLYYGRREGVQKGRFFLQRTRANQR